MCESLYCSLLCVTFCSLISINWFLLGWETRAATGQDACLTSWKSELFPHLLWLNIKAVGNGMVAAVSERVREDRAPWSFIASLSVSIRAQKTYATMETVAHTSSLRMLSLWLHYIQLFTVETSLTQALWFSLASAQLYFRSSWQHKRSLFGITFLCSWKKKLPFISLLQYSNWH